MARFRRFPLAPSEEVSLTRMEAIEGVRERRAGLKSALSGLEVALASPAPGRVAEWATGVNAALGALRDVWAKHVADTESPGSFLDELVEAAPRLANQVRRLRHEHTEINAEIARASRQLQTTPGTDPDGWVAEMRNSLTGLLSALARHRQRGADLVYQAFDVDIGGGS